MYQIRKEILKSLPVQTASSSARLFKTKKTKLGAFRESVFIQTAQNHKSCQEFFMSEHFETFSSDKETNPLCWWTRKQQTVREKDESTNCKNEYESVKTFSCQVRPETI